MRRGHDLITRWLAAEKADRGAEAEGLLATLFAQLSLPAPPPGFADRVLLSAGLLAPPARHWLWGRLAKAAVASGLVLTGWSVGTLPWAVRWLAESLSPAAVVRGARDGLVILTHWLSAAFELWLRVLDLGRLAALVAKTPEVTAALVLATGVSLLAFRLLYAVIAQERSASYVEI